jgi:imidazolonepropionase-like amidohydrolase
MNKRLLLLVGLLLLTTSTCLQAQETFLRNDVKDERPEAYAFTNVTVQVSPTEKIDGATVLIKDGKIVEIGKSIRVPTGYQQMDLSGKWLYPGMIDLYTSYGMPEVKSRGFSFFGGAEQFEPKTKGPYNANEAIKAHVNAVENFTVDAKDATAWRAMGFGAVLSFHPDGLARGSSTLAALGEGRANEVILKDKAAAHYSFNRGTSTQVYPVSAMGQISLLRQTYLDAKWYNAQPQKPFVDRSLDAWLSLQSLPQIFEATNWMTVLRADKIGDEFGVQYIIKGGGDDYKRIKEVKAAGAPIIVPVDFPDAYDVSDPIDAYKVDLSDMKHWELAPTNLAQLEKNGIEVALTTHGLKNKKDFWPNLRKAIKQGFSKKAALAALTTTPAKLVKMQDQLGTISKGKIANLIITSGDIFEEKTVIHENWVQGKRYIHVPMDATDLQGNYVLALNGQSYDLRISGPAGKHQASIQMNDTTKVKVDLKVDDESLTLNFNPAPKDPGESLSLSGWTNGKNLSGTGQSATGKWLSWQATFAEDAKKEEEKKSEKEEPEDELGPVIFPFLAYGASEVPKQERILIKNATVWTMEAAGILEATDVLLENGKISQIGKNLNAGGAKVIDGTGKHLTPGVIDEHTHIGGGGNEVLSNSAMVRIGDQINSEDINIYRALSGGVTSVQVLHGSSNPIGGQSALLKLRWGMAPEALKIKDADEYIKFALGENVKRSRSESSIRYPQTRMGVEQVYMDAFSDALEYEKSWKAFNASTKEGKVAPRRDLAMDAVLEIINEERFITCHSYVQSEINMLMKVADHFDFKVNTFTHIIEGYKVADKMKEHGAGASSFSDWWAYKWEVRYGVPYSPAIMAREGVVTAINSDDSEMMRRLNQEAAKSVKYGQLSEMEAMKMVTINPAKLLHLDDRIGSLKVGKDADVVLWTNHPLSIYANVDHTIVDGTIFYSLERDEMLRESNNQERARLVQKMKNSKSKGGSMQPAMSRSQYTIHCDDVIFYNGQN